MEGSESERKGEEVVRVQHLCKVLQHVCRQEKRHLYVVGIVLLLMLAENVWKRH